MKLKDRKTVKGAVRARCPKCDTWKPLDLENFYMGGDGEPYLGHCRTCERTRSAAWHREHPRASKAASKSKAAPRKSAAKKPSAKRAPAKRAASA